MNTGERLNALSPVQDRVVEHHPIWPLGFTFNVLLGIGFFVLAVRRLRVPYGELPTGMRVA
jgi:hypothetical protein